MGRLRQLESSPSSNPRRHIPLTPTRRTLCARAGDTKVDNLFASLYVVFVYNAVQPHPTITDPALRLANATELGAENPSLAPASGYVYARMRALAGPATLTPHPSRLWAPGNKAPCHGRGRASLGGRRASLARLTECSEANWSSLVCFAF